jgi:alpha-galactosidase
MTIAAFMQVGWAGHGPQRARHAMPHAAFHATHAQTYLLPSGYDTIVIDSGWYWYDNANPGGCSDGASVDALSVRERPCTRSWRVCAGFPGESVDSYGRPYPRVDQYPSAADGRGWATIASKVRRSAVVGGVDVARPWHACAHAALVCLAQLHGMGLKLGLWMLRGIPNIAVDNDLPIAGACVRAFPLCVPVCLTLVL